MCKYEVYESGSRSYGPNIPFSCQGAYFPGDEPGNYCEINGQYCYLEDWAGSACDCPIKEPSGQPCSYCGSELFENGNGVLYCDVCGQVEG